MRTVQKMLAKGASISAKVIEGEMLGTPLHWAAEGGHEAVCALLLEKGAEIDSKDKTDATPLHKAGKGGHISCVRLLLEKGANANAKDHNLRTPLHEAATEDRSCTLSSIHSYM